ARGGIRCVPWFAPVGCRWFGTRRSPCECPRIARSPWRAPWPRPCRAPCIRGRASRRGTPARRRLRLRRWLSRAGMRAGVGPGPTAASWSARWRKDGADGAGERRPFRGFGLKLLSAASSQFVELRLATELGHPPLGFDPAFALHAIERGIEGAFFDLDGVARRLLEPARDGVAMSRSPAQRFEHECVEGAVETIFRFGAWHRLPRQSWLPAIVRVDT